jgi:glycosyltransferase involved in cell wall biosynthesis
MVRREDLPERFAVSDVVVCNHISPDKIVYEAAGSGVPVLASHPAFDELFEGIEPSLLFEHASPESLADRLAALLETPAEQRRALGKTLRQRVSERHSVDTWADAMLSHARR